MGYLGAFTHNDRVFHRPLACLVFITSAELLALLANIIGQPYSTSPIQSDAYIHLVGDTSLFDFQ